MNFQIEVNFYQSKLLEVKGSGWKPLAPRSPLWWSLTTTDRHSFEVLGCFAVQWFVVSVAPEVLS